MGDVGRSLLGEGLVTLMPLGGALEEVPTEVSTPLGEVPTALGEVGVALVALADTPAAALGVVPVGATPTVLGVVPIEGTPTTLGDGAIALDVLLEDVETFSVGVWRGNVSGGDFSDSSSIMTSPSWWVWSPPSLVRNFLTNLLPIFIFFKNVFFLDFLSCSPVNDVGVAGTSSISNMGVSNVGVSGVGVSDGEDLEGFDWADDRERVMLL